MLSKVRRGPHPARDAKSKKKERSSLCGTSKVAKVGSGRGSNLLKSDRRRHLTKRSSLSTKWSSLRGRTKVAKVGPSPGEREAGSNLLKSDRRRHLTKRSSLHKKRSSLRGQTKVAKVGPLRARVKSAKVRPTPLTSYYATTPAPRVLERRRVSGVSVRHTHSAKGWASSLATFLGTATGTRLTIFY